jgi:hypothetical protein
MESLKPLTARNIVRAMLALVFVAISASMLVAGLTAQAQTTATSPIAQPAKTDAKPANVGKPLSPGVIKTATPIATTESKPLWKELTPAQQASLTPLAANWSTIEEAQKRKWIALSNSYATLPPAEQQKMHSRMAEWASLSQQQRTQARMNFAESNKLAPKEKAEKTASKTADWEAYQALSAEDKQKLAAKAAPKPAGAAMAIKPASPAQLATVPSTRRTAKSGDAPDKQTAVDSNTLLPKPAAGADASGSAGSTVQKN